MAEKQKNTSIRRFPWKPLAAGAATIGAGYGLGHLGSGIVSEGMGRVPHVGESWAKLTPKQKKRYAALLGGGAGAATTLAATAAHTATQANLLDYLHRRSKKERQEKTASVMVVYEEALRRLLDE